MLTRIHRAVVVTACQMGQYPSRSDGPCFAEVSEPRLFARQAQTLPLRCKRRRSSYGAAIPG